MVRLNTELIDRARLLRGWTWTDLGRHAKFSPPTRTKLANGAPVSIVTARRCCKALRVSLRAALILPGEQESDTETVQPVRAAV